MANEKTFTKDEYLIINNALNEILSGPEAIEMDEFHTRIGANFEDAEALLFKVSHLLKSANECE
jgi:hypothetical protein